MMHQSKRCCQCKKAGVKNSCEMLVAGGQEMAVMVGQWQKL